MIQQEENSQPGNPLEPGYKSYGGLLILKTLSDASFTI
jgi:hypothetical protein